MRPLSAVGRGCKISLKNQNGFTLTELMLAMVLFSTVLVISTVGFIGMNRAFNRGIIKKQLSEGVQAVSDDISRSLRAQPNTSEPISCDGVDLKCANYIKDWKTLKIGTICYAWQTPGSDPAVHAKGGIRRSVGACTEESGKTTEILSSRYVVREGIAVSKLSGSNIAGDELYSVKGIFSTSENSAIHFADPNIPGDNLRCKGTAEDSNVPTCAVQNFNLIINPRGNSE